jgi:membrane fusion protein, multidrug efflux system
MSLGDRTSKPAVLLSLLLAGTVLTGCKEEKPHTEAPLPVRVVVVAPATSTDTRSYTGVVRPRYETDLGFRVGGKITERLINVGDPVSRGQVIARLDTTDYKLALEQQDAELRAATSSRQQAVAAEERYRKLLQQTWVAPAAYEQRKATADEARERVERATRAVETARNQVAYAELKADHDGIVSQISVETGQVVSAGQVIARVARLDEKEVVVAVPEQRLEELHASTARIDLWANGQKTYAAHLREVSPEADRATRTFQAKFAIDSADKDVSLGMTATVRLARAATAATTKLPSSALHNDGRGSSVWVVDSATGTVKRVVVDVAAYGQDEVTIRSGLTGGERVVAIGTHLIDEARRVRIVEERAQSSNKSAAAALTR